MLDKTSLIFMVPVSHDFIYFLPYIHGFWRLLAQWMAQQLAQIAEWSGAILEPFGAIGAPQKIEKSRGITPLHQPKMPGGSPFPSTAEMRAAMSPHALRRPVRWLSRTLWCLESIPKMAPQLPSGKHTNSYWKWPIWFVYLPIKDSDFP